MPIVQGFRRFFEVIFIVGGSLKRSLGMASIAFTIPKAFGFEAATRRKLMPLVNGPSLPGIYSRVPNCTPGTFPCG